MRNKISLVSIFVLFIYFASLQPVYSTDIQNITSFGAIGDGLTLNTKFIQKAIDKAAENGGTVIVPSGRFLTGTLFLKSNVNLELSPGAVLLGSTNIKDYIDLTWGHHEDRTPWHLVVVKDATHVTICGQGTIDGNGPSFWEKNRNHEFEFYREIEYRPSPMIEITGSDNVVVKDVNLNNAAGWCLHFLNSTNCKALGLTIKNSLYGPNSDGIDITGCKNVLVNSCNISTGDDAIALKTTEDSGDCEDIAVSNCVLETNCVALRIGFESRKDFRRISANNLVVKRCSRVINLLSVEGAVIEDVNISDVIASTNCSWSLTRPIEIDVRPYANAYKIAIKEHPNFGRPKPILKKGAIRNISLTNFNIRTDGRIMIRAGEGEEASNILLSNIFMNYPMIDDPYPLAAGISNDLAFFAETADSSFRSARSVIIAQNIKGLFMDKIRVSPPVYPITEDWLVLRSGHRPWGEQRNKEIISGQYCPDFSVLWARKVSGNIDLTTALPLSTKAPKTIITDCGRLKLVE